MVFLFSAYMYANSCFATDNAILHLNVKGMHCAGCENKVKQVLNSIDGVVSTQSVSYDSGTANITIDKDIISEEALVSKLAESTGYEVALVKPEGTTCSKGKKSSCCQSGQKTPACTPKGAKEEKGK